MDDPRRNDRDEPWLDRRSPESWHERRLRRILSSIQRDVDEGGTARVRQALLDMSDPELLASFPRRRFVPASNSDYQPILDTAQAIGLIDS